MSSTGQKLRNLFFHNIGLKLVALTAAVLLWYSVATEPVAEVGFTVPVEFHGVSPDVEIVTDAAPHANVRLRGPDRLLRNLRPSELHVVLELGRSQIGERTYELTPAQVQVPGTIEVVQVSPARLRVGFDRRVSRTVPVLPRVTGAFVQGYALQEVKAEPAQVTIVGPAARVNAVQSAATDPIDATGVVGSATFTTSAYVPDPNVRVARPSQITVVVSTAARPPEPPPPAETPARKKNEKTVRN